MDEIVGLIGRDELIADLAAEIRKGKHAILTGSVGIGKSAVLKAALEQIGDQLELLIRLHDHQAKGQFVGIARQMLAQGLIGPAELDQLAEFHGTPPAQIDTSVGSTPPNGPGPFLSTSERFVPRLFFVLRLAALQQPGQGLCSVRLAW
jgi:MoxR-like ATPase